MTAPAGLPARARWLIAGAALLVNRERRAAWREEWESELWYGAESGGMTAGAQVRAAGGAWRDALATRTLRSNGPNRAGERLLGGSAMMKELRVALRGLARSPGFAFLAILTLALGIGANAALFTIVDSVLLRPLGYADADELVVVQHPVSGNATGTWQLSLHGFFWFQDENAVFSDIGIYTAGSVNLASDAGPDRARSALVSASLFRALGARPAAGRMLQDADNEPGNESVAVLSHEFWQRRFGGSGDVIGSTIRINGREGVIVGVAERGLTLPRQAVDVWLPMALDRASRPINAHFLSSVARLRDGVTLEAARENIAALTRRLPEVLPTAYDEGFMRDYHFTAEVVPLRDEVVGEASTTLWIVFGGVGIVLLIACANVANLFLVRAEGRAREVAVRSALGASRAHLTRQFMTESVLLALLAGALGLFLAWAGVRTLLTLAPAALPRLSEVALRGSTLGFTFAIALVAGLLFGLFPLSHLTERRRASALRDGGQRSTASRARHRVRGALVVAQVALALVLLAGAGLMIRSFRELRAVEPGFDPEGALTFAVSLPIVNYPTPLDAHRFWDTLLREVRALPGVTRAGVTTSVPLRDGASCSVFFVRDRPVTPGAPAPCIEYVLVSPELFETMGIDIVQGRTLTEGDVYPPTGVALVSRALAAQFWPDGTALGRGVRIFGDQPPFYEVVGVVEDVRLRELQGPPAPLVYLSFIPLADDPASFRPIFSARVVVRTTRADPTSLTAELRGVVARIDPEIPISEVETLEAIVGASLARVSFVMLLLGIAAGVALLLGTVGLYGVVAYVVNERRTEIGIRMALGARVAGIARMVLGHALRLAVAGVILGFAAALGLGRVLRSQLFGVSSTDPLTLAFVAVLLLGVALVAAWIPARRATRVDPVETMRSA
ncbi:MAG TPA: ABC transporter permease [Albitalea sp.]